jgi:hypothetical protein
MIRIRKLEVKLKWSIFDTLSIMYHVSHCQQTAKLPSVKDHIAKNQQTAKLPSVKGLEEIIDVTTLCDKVNSEAFTYGPSAPDYNSILTDPPASAL